MHFFMLLFVLVVEFLGIALVLTVVLVGWCGIDFYLLLAPLFRSRLLECIWYTVSLVERCSTSCGDEL